jgi:site-specific recombinase XerD
MTADGCVALSRVSSFGALVDGWLSGLGAGRLAPASVAAYRRDLTGVAGRIAADGDVGALRVAQLTKPALRKAFESWAGDHAAASVLRAHSAWSSFFDFLVGADVVDGNPMAAVAKPDRPPPEPRAIRDPDAAARLLEAAATVDARSRAPWPERDLALAATFCVTGIREGEAVALHGASLRGDPGLRHLEVAGQRGTVRAIPVDAALDAVLDAYRATRAARFPDHDLDDPATPLFVDVRGRRLNADQVRYLIERLYVRAGLRERVPAGALVHALRHTFAAAALRAGADVVGLRTLLGHRSLDTTGRYLDLEAPRLRGLIEDHPGQIALSRHVAAGDRPAGPPERGH